jgi:hypothetical protein
VKLFIKNFLMSSDVSTEGEIMTWFDTFSETEARNTEPKTHFYRHLLRPVRDAAATFVVFAVVTMTCASAPSSASPTQVGHLTALAPPAAATTLAASGGAKTLTYVADRSQGLVTASSTRPTSRETAWSLLGLGVSLLAALNLAFYRHLRHAYANPRNRQNQA